MNGSIYKLEEICEIKSGKRIPKEMDYVEYETEHPYIRARDIKEGKINTGNLIYLEENVFNKIKKYIINTGDIAITVVGASVGDTGYAEEKVDGFNLTENAVRLTNFKHLVNSRYLHYVLSQKQYFDYMQLIAGAAAQPKLGIYKVQRMKVELPLLDKQNRISEILFVYDSLIENNNKRIINLEKIAKNLYKEWFVRFRFPGYKDCEFEHGIPNGWEYKKLNEIFDVCYGKDHKKLGDGEVPVYGSGGIMRYCEKSLYEGESVLIPRKGTLNNIMYVNWPFWTVDTMFYTKLKAENMAKYMYYVMSSMNMESYNSGAALPSMTTDILSHLKVIVPNEDLLKKFDDFVEVLFKQRLLIERKNDFLIKQRDLLLPRLMSGKLEVK